MKTIIKGDSEDRLNIDSALESLFKIVGADDVEIEFDNKNRWFLFNLGMLFAHMHYCGKKNINLISDIEKTPHKSFGNVILDIIENDLILLPNYEINDKKAFIISPVRSNEDKITEQLRKYKKKLIESRNFDCVHYPFDDTDQNDPIGTRICRDNFKAESSSRTIKIWYKDDSYGSVFDIGIGFMLKYYLDNLICPNKKRKIEIINKASTSIDFNKYYKFLVNLENDG